MQEEKLPSVDTNVWCKKVLEVKKIGNQSYINY